MARATTDARPVNVTVEELRQYLTEVEGKTATQRIMVGINHKEGIPQTKLAEWYDVSRTTIHNWLNRLERLEEETLEEAIYDDERPGRPSKLDAEDRKQLEATLAESPDAVGYDTTSWTPRLVREHIEGTFDVEYCLSHVRELMHESGVSWGSGQSEPRRQRVRPDAVRPDDETRHEETEILSDGPESAEEDHPQQRVHGCR